MKKFAIAILCCMIIVGGFVLQKIWAAYPGSVGQMGTENWVQTSPLGVTVTGGSLTVVTVSGGTAATTAFSISGGTLDRVSALPALTISAGTLGNVTLSGTSSVQGAVSITGTSTVAVSSGTVTASIPGYATFGSGSLAFTGTGQSTLNLSGTAATSVPCSGLVLSCTTSGCLVGSSSGGGTIPLPANLPMQLPLGNVNSVWVTGGSANSVGFGYWR